MLRSLAFRKKREKDWKKLEAYLMRVEKKGVRSLSSEELYHMVQLYRNACSSLAVARSISLDPHLHSYLEQLVTRGYFIIYCSHPVSSQGGFFYFFTHTFPALAYQFRRFLLVAMGVFFLGMAVAWALVATSPQFYFLFVDPALAGTRIPGASKEQLRHSLEANRGASAEKLTVFSSFLFSHNTRVGFFCFALGIFVGLPTLYLLFLNGAMLGAMSWLYHEAGLAIEWWAWILPHGVTEILAIWLCGAAGLAVGQVILEGGEERRWLRLKKQANSVALLVVGAMALFFFAALIEGYFRQSYASTGVRYLLALTTGAFWLFYFGVLGHKRYGSSGN